LKQLWLTNKGQLAQAFMDGYGRSLHDKPQPTFLPIELAQLVEQEFESEKGRWVSESVVRMKIPHRSDSILGKALSELARMKAWDANATTNAALASLSHADSTGQKVLEFVASRPMPWQAPKPAVPSSCFGPSNGGASRSTGGNAVYAAADPSCVAYDLSINGPAFLRVLLEGAASREFPALKSWWLKESKNIFVESWLSNDFATALLRYADSDSADALGALLARAAQVETHERQRLFSQVAIELTKLPSQKAAAFRPVFQRFANEWSEAYRRELEMKTSYVESTNSVLTALSKQFESAQSVKMTGRVYFGEAPGQSIPRRFRFLWQRSGDFLIEEADPRGADVVWRIDNCLSQVVSGKYKKCNDRSPPDAGIFAYGAVQPNAKVALPPIAPLLLEKKTIVGDPSKSEYSLGWPREQLVMEATRSNSDLHFIGRLPLSGRVLAQVVVDASSQKTSSITVFSGDTRTWEFDTIEVNGSDLTRDLHHFPGVWASVERLGREHAELRSSLMRIGLALLFGLIIGGLVSEGASSESQAIRLRRIRLRVAGGFAITTTVISILPFLTKDVWLFALFVYPLLVPLAVASFGATASLCIATWCASR
jgi:hypothetical protein